MEVKLCAFADEAGAGLSEQIDALKRNGIGLLEIRSVDGVNVKDIGEERAREIQTRLARAGIGVFSIGSPLGKSAVTDDFDEEIRRLGHILRLAGIFLCGKIRVFSFYTDKPAGARYEVIRRLREMVKLAARSGATLYHENEKGIYGDTARRVSDILDSVPGLKSVYDPANYIQVGESADATIADVLPRADYLHIKDVIASTGELVPAGYGDCKISEIVASLKADTVMSVEPHLKVFPGFQSLGPHGMKNKFAFASNASAFDAAVDGLKEILKKTGFTEESGKWIKR
ncbi:MAG: sugar phosphate isomerase/epimerase [Clostridiales bacterium]|jgi:sugar phosphate isomerase/epimerase|nr:sugar phosphate isomerase/epimerase [Clostridiales bacterium]